MEKTELLDLQEKLADSYKYKKLPEELAVGYRKLWKDSLPSNLPIIGSDISIYTADGTLITDGYDRIVIGDYGAFIEFSEHQANAEAFTIQPGQEYRIYDKRYANNVKYNWLTIEGTDLKIYQQKKGVCYADYKPGKYYISPCEDIVYGYSINPSTEMSGSITLGFSVIPKHCGECPLYMSNVFVDDEPSWGSGISHFCPFGADYHGCLVERPADCPIKINKRC